MKHKNCIIWQCSKKSSLVKMKNKMLPSVCEANLHVSYQCLFFFNLEHISYDFESLRKQFYNIMLFD